MLGRKTAAKMVTSVVVILPLALIPGAAFAADDGSTAPEVISSSDGREGKALASCFGKEPTIVALPGVETVGSPESDVIVGTDGDDVILGEGGDDLICSGKGADSVDGGTGRDQINGGAGNDRLAGGEGEDTLAGGRGNDFLDGGDGDDMCSGGPGQDWLPSCNDGQATQGTLRVKRNTLLKGPHRGDVIVVADRVTLDCAGHEVTGRGGGFGILLDKRKRVTIKNCDVSNFSNGINLFSARGNRLISNQLHDNSMQGIALFDSDKNKVVRNATDNNGFGRWGTTGIDLVNSHRNVLRGNTSSGNGEANYRLVNGSSRNTLTANESVGGVYGFGVSGDGNVLQGNRVTSARDHGVLSEGQNNEIIANSVQRSGVGITVAGTGNEVSENEAVDSQRVGFEDRAFPGANTYTDNHCTGSGEGESDPDGLCADIRPIDNEEDAP